MAKIIAFVNSMSGVGKTAVAMQTAAGLKKRGHKVLILDMDPCADITAAFGVEPATGKGMCGFLKGEAKFDDVVIRTAAGDLLPSNFESVMSEPTMNALVGKEFVLTNAMSNIAKNYDYVLADCPSANSVMLFNALLYSHYAIVVSSGENEAMKWLCDQIEYFKQTTSLFSKKLNFIGVLLTKLNEKHRVDDKLSKRISDVSQTGGIKFFKSRIVKSEIVGESMRKCRTLIDYAPESDVTKQYERFVDELVEIMEDKKKKRIKK